MFLGFWVCGRTFEFKFLASSQSRLMDESHCYNHSATSLFHGAELCCKYPKPDWWHVSHVTYVS